MITKIISNEKKLTLDIYFASKIQRSIHTSWYGVSFCAVLYLAMFTVTRLRESKLRQQCSFDEFIIQYILFLEKLS